MRPSPSRHRPRAAALLLPLAGAVALAGCTLSVGQGPRPERLAADAATSAWVYPRAGAGHVHPETTISFRGATVQSLGEVSVTGSDSGAHPGSLRAHPDGGGATFVPDEEFEAGETVTVRTDATVVGASDDGTFDLGVMTPVELGGGEGGAPAPDGTHRPPRDLETLPDLGVADVQVADGAGAGPDGLVLATAGENGEGVADQVVLLRPDGGLVFSSAAREGSADGTENAAVQLLDGEPVLTWFEGESLEVQGAFRGRFVVVDDGYEELYSLEGENGYEPDLHELVLTDRGTAVYTCYVPQQVDLTSVDGPADGVVIDSVVQEVDLDSGDVLFEWHALDDLDVTTSLADVGGRSLDATHINSIEEDRRGDLLVSLRHVSSLLQVDRGSATVQWGIGGGGAAWDEEGVRRPRFPYLELEGDPPSLQHDARWLDADTISFFDNANARRGPSRGVVLDVDPVAGTAKTVREITSSDDLFALYGSSARPDPDGGWLLAYADSGTVTWHGPDDPDDAESWRATMGSTSYRAQVVDWEATPVADPVVVRTPGGLAVSWNGATEVVTWRVETGTDEPVEVPWEDLETEIPLPPGTEPLRVVALDAGGAALRAVAVPAVG
ncbi:arylsulfotransferase family protein [Aquipuribacter sp. SD81]|uniref:arylsulfotransferase family protein n=1 Tax=Aquipuribacter sp. SD81 TaxID=3127703 RepID=UPI003018B0A6